MRDSCLPEGAITGFILWNELGQFLGEDLKWHTPQEDDLVGLFHGLMYDAENRGKRRRPPVLHPIEVFETLLTQPKVLEGHKVRFQAIVATASEELDLKHPPTLHP